MYLIPIIGSVLLNIMTFLKLRKKSSDIIGSISADDKADQDRAKFLNKFILFFLICFFLIPVAILVNVFIGFEAIFNYIIDILINLYISIKFLMYMLLWEEFKTNFIPGICCSNNIGGNNALDNTDEFELN